MSTLNLIDQLEQTVADQALEIAALKAQQCVGNERGHDTKGSRKALGAINAKLRAKVGMLEREVTRLNASRVSVEPAHSDVIVPRELLKLIDEAMCDFLGEDDPLLGDLRALLAGGEV
jgi:hypothetical protein